ncbi:MAG: tryptophan-rich sensory protein [Mesorhizobium sp.]|uniref:TspO/MBR family protein n=1 Tax=unclassified Mesorhizobium TaxID=325217 RepID=UPI000FCB1009|nr:MULTISPECIES: TspO/MBR family protein [unclassified Mesorhizobium]RUV46631.1 tryptophan-rich sensory protein [Mesorhizobium sp. M5C.F.Ca.IN.020.29.1.1]RWI13026.1 MAG: tryptophan-rich sensory protein [Mesorhizobium sp.]RWK44710.1 MAG: tryptophan-rich sensory protein [Mesorhizobium sp.]RWK48980.1 MAG: tryptophan-rich sensory protein [Mesorhizobium sp.]RWK89483.1 MAG: tryptophan-rich sensory protein [Mesorhizobium sp.]
MINPGTSTLLLILAAIVPVAAAAIAGNLATIPNVPTWYAHLTKPSFNPPNWVFAPVWTTLYLMMAYAFYRVLKANADWISFAVAIFLIQITLNAAWSWVFFSFHNPRGGLVVITLLWLAIVLTILAFWQIDPTASMLLWPYLLWVSFAAALNWEIDRLN